MTKKNVSERKAYLIRPDETLHRALEKYQKNNNFKTMNKAINDILHNALGDLGLSAERKRQIDNELDTIACSVERIRRL